MEINTEWHDAATEKPSEARDYIVAVGMVYVCGDKLSFVCIDHWNGIGWRNFDPSLWNGDNYKVTHWMAWMPEKPEGWRGAE